MGGWLLVWLTGFESDGRLSDYLSETGHSAQEAPREDKEGEGLASGHCVVWVAGCWFG